MTMAPSSTFQFSSPDQPFNVFPSNKDIQPACSAKSMGSGWRRPAFPPGACCWDVADAAKNSATAKIDRLVFIVTSLASACTLGPRPGDTKAESLALTVFQPAEWQASRF